MEHIGASAPRDDEAIVVIAHGSRSPEANQAHFELCTSLSARLGESVTAAFLELAAPDLDTAIGSCAEGGANRIIVVPYFLHPGNHTGRDIPALIEVARRRRPGCEITLCPLFGADPALVELLARQLDRARTRMRTGG